MSNRAAGRLYTTADYHRMAEVGILNEDDRVELIEGVIVPMSPIGSPHAGCVTGLTTLFVERLGRRAVVWPQNPIVLNRYSEPQPDVTLLRPRADFYRERHPEPPDVLLLVEVADSSQIYDRRTKIPLYARAGIAEVWLVDLPAEIIEVHRRASLRSYLDVTIRRRGQRLSPAAFPRTSFAVDDILG